MYMYMYIYIYIYMHAFWSVSTFLQSFCTAQNSSHNIYVYVYTCIPIHTCMHIYYVYSHNIYMYVFARM